MSLLQILLSILAAEIGALAVAVTLAGGAIDSLRKRTAILERKERKRTRWERRNQVRARRKQ